MISLKINGLNGFLNNVNSSSTIDKANKSSIGLLKDTAEINSPVDTGRLRNSYGVNYMPLMAELYNTAPYFQFVDAKQHFIDKTIDSKTVDVDNIFSKNVDIWVKDLTK